MKTSKKNRTSLAIHIFFILFALVCFVPFIMVVSASFTSPRALSEWGFRIFPRELDVSAYAYLFKNPKIVINAYAVTIFITATGTFLDLVVNSMGGYCLSRSSILPGLKTFLTYYLYIPTLFGGGLTASYIVNTQYLGFTDSVWVMVIPGLCSAYNIFMIRTFTKQLPQELFDAAKVDGASEFGIYFRVAIPLSKPVLATLGFLSALGRWNEWYGAMIYIRSEEKRPLQYLLQRMMMDLSALQMAMEKVPGLVQFMEMPGENLRMALLVVCIGPMMCFFPFFQKYFTKGMVVGAVKG